MKENLKVDLSMAWSEVEDEQARTLLAWLEEILEFSRIAGTLSRVDQ